MERWIVYALVSMAFAGFTSAIAKLGLAGISGTLGLAVRTYYVFAFVLLFADFALPSTELRSLGVRDLAWLGLSGATTACSWALYYKARSSSLGVEGCRLTDKLLRGQFRP